MEDGLTPRRRGTARNLVQLVKELPASGNTNVRYRVQKSQKMGPVLSHMSPVHISHSISILILSSQLCLHLRSSPFFKVSEIKRFKHVSPLPCIHHALPISSSLFTPFDQYLVMGPD
jgi:hypothetical protein